jgi:hypothetical protein
MDDIEQVEVWLISEGGGRGKARELFEELKEPYIPPMHRLVTISDATPEAVSDLAEVSLWAATEALANPGKLILIGEEYECEVSAKYYLKVTKSRLHRWRV